MSNTGKSSTYFERLYLVGMPGAGKSTLGKKLAKEIGWNFLDLDEAIVKQHGTSISEIFATKGEATFRMLEQQTLHQTGALNNYIIACGGGTVAYNSNLQWLLSSGLTLYLKAEISLILDRIRHSKTERPLFAGLSTEEKEEKIKKIFSERAPLFEQSILHENIPLKSIKALKNKALTAICKNI
ncbi:MAG: shikimate kinase [Bacteroidetes bacterium]|jgi:shikimate kinase|nr:shikimate kinase [Bacteroidota bacterium]